ncbi:TIGR02594 family protein [Verrucomicrobium spinosum]|uniref:TIGR02594 family protein n=1 Tax=Verrucomicrobium spinosum TaxID=2736 RepID=UPI00031AD950|nr:TIGR02594 family protein [Verrucomicrobium spinosum]
MNQRIYAEGLKYIGVKEWPGPKTNPQIAEMFRLAPDWLDQDDSKTAWCGIFRGTVGHLTATGVPAEHYRAANWLNWGEPVKLDDARQGDTVVFSRTGGNHVAIFDRLEGDKVWVLGGNQGNAVSIAPYARSLVRGVRRFKESK